MKRRNPAPSPADWIAMNRGNMMRRPKGKVVYVIIGHAYNRFTHTGWACEARVMGTNRRVLLSWADVKRMRIVAR